MPEPPFSTELPYPSRRQPIYARNCVATSQPLAAQAGLDIMRRGGNAIDAAVAAAACLTVVEPTSNGIGSDAFALVWTGGGLHGLNASGRAPALMTPDRFTGEESIPFRGWHGVTTPGAVSAWAALVEQHGALDLETVLEPAAAYAERGFLASPVLSLYWRSSARGYARTPEGSVFDAWKQTFAPGGDGPLPGELVRLPDHARTLREIGETGGLSFYEGRLADAMDDAARRADADGLNASLRKQDLAAHQYDWVRPIAQRYHGYDLHEIPPNGQGLAALIALGILAARFDLSAEAVDSARWVHLQLEAMKLAFRDAHRYIADPAHMPFPSEALLDPAYLAERAALIDPDRATDFEHGTPRHGGTIYLTTADEHGNMVSYIQSNYTGFGSGIVVPGTGISLQNRGCCFTLEEGHPNRVGPGKRPYHTIIPGFVTRPTPTDDEPVMSFGVMGGFMQPQGHAQVLIRIADHGQNPQAAIDAPRWRVDDGLEVNLEEGFPAETYERLREMGHKLAVSPAGRSGHGRGQAIWKLDDGYLAASEPRTDGQAVGF